MNQDSLFVFVAIFVACVLASTNKGTRVLTDFDYGNYVDAVARPEKTRVYSPRGIALRQAINPVDTINQIKGTGFTSIHCNIQNRTWSVLYDNALDPRVWGVINTTVLARCYSGNVAQFYLTELPASRVDTSSPTQITTFVQFIMNNSAVKQNVLACSFQLFIYSLSSSSLQSPQLISTFEHLCNKADGKQCGFYEVFCAIDTDQFKGSAMFWWCIQIIEYAVLFAVFFLLARSELAKEKDRLDQATEYLNSKPIESKFRFDSSDIEKERAAIEQKRGRMKEELHGGFSGTIVPIEQHASGRYSQSNTSYNAPRYQQVQQYP